MKKRQRDKKEREKKDRIFRETVRADRWIMEDASLLLKGGYKENKIPAYLHLHRVGGRPGMDICVTSFKSGETAFGISLLRRDSHPAVEVTLSDKDRATVTVYGPHGEIFHIELEESGEMILTSWPGEPDDPKKSDG